MQPDAIHAEGLTRDFKSIRAVDNLTLSVPSGSIFGFLGPNGAGKTTTIRLLLGLIMPTAGNASVLGYDISREADDIRQRCGALLEHNGLYERLSAEDNLQFYGRVWHLSKSERDSRIKDLLQHLDLWDRRREITGTWSTGMKQKLAIARTLLHRPELVFMDEPTAGLDPLAASAVRDDLASLATREGVTIFLTTHNLNEAERLCQQVGVIRQGKLLAVGSVEKLRSQSSQPGMVVSGNNLSHEIIQKLLQRADITNAEIQEGKLIIMLTADADGSKIVSQLVDMGIEIEEVNKSKASLEDVFIKMMQEEQDDQ